MHHPDNNLHSGTSVLYSCPAGLSVQVPLPRNTAGPRCRPSQRSEVELPERKSPLGDVFTGMPADVTWHHAALTPAELATVRYIDYPYWTEFSGGTRLAADGA